MSDIVIEIDLAAELEALRGSDSYQAADHAAKTIAKQPSIRVVLIALKPGGHMHEHHADWAFTVQGLDGRMEFEVGDQKVALTPGRLLTVAAGVPHSVVGIDESAFVLTIGGMHSAA